jgi:nucleotide-binding universal stress UspA family protein
MATGTAFAIIVNMRIIAELMTRGPLIIDQQQPMAEARNRMEQLQARHLPVIHGSRLVGIVSLADLMANPDAVVVGDVMSSDPFTVAPDAAAATVAREMVTRRIDAAVVAQAGRIVGIFTATDALRALAEIEEQDTSGGVHRWPAKILCPIDFSEGSREAVRQALELARDSGGSVTLFHGYALPVTAVGEVATVSAASLERLDQETDAALAAWRDEIYRPGGPEIRIAKGLGSGPDTIVRHAADHHFDLVVIGTHGRTGVKRVLLGSVAEAVVRRAPCPVLVVRRKGDAG